MFYFFYCSNNYYIRGTDRKLSEIGTIPVTTSIIESLYPELKFADKKVIWLEKFNARLHWDRLADNRSDEFSCVDLLEKFKDRWDWDEYSDNGTLTMEILEKFADRLNWKNVIGNWRIRDLDVNAVLDKFGDRIPATEFKDSKLWDELVERKEKDLKKTLCLG